MIDDFHIAVSNATLKTLQVLLLVGSSMVPGTKTGRATNLIVDPPLVIKSFKS